MRGLVVFVVVLSAGLACAVFAALDAHAPDALLREAFAKAGAAYDASDYAAALRGYEELRAQGLASSELFYNLGNTHFRRGEFGLAVLAYRRAWMLAPRDPDIAANLGFALQQAGAAAPEQGPLRRLALRVSVREYVFVGVAAYWLGMAALACAIVLPARRRLFVRGAAVAGGVLVLAVVGGFSWWTLEQRPEAVVVDASQTALFAPVESAKPHFKVPQGAIVRLQDSSGPWAKIAYGKEIGWIRKASCVPVYPWRSESDTPGSEHDETADPT
jgi:tetratricopeptide (TPR) repeat protein